MCKYHGTHGHRIKGCRQLREEVARLFDEGQLREFLGDRARNHFRERDASKKDNQEEPLHIIHMIIGGVDTPQGHMLKYGNIPTTGEKRTRGYVPEGTLSFGIEEAEGSSVNIIRSWVVEQLGLQNQVVPAARVLNGSNMASETTKGEITLPVNVAGTIQNTEFHVIKGDMRYNALLEKPWIHNMKAVPSTLHQVMKFPTSDGVKTIYREQHAAKEMFAVDEKIEDDEKRFLTPRAFVAPDDSDTTKSTIEELKQVILIKYLPEKK
uniref:Uncharacterized protein n=1 Tax=Nicotiana tabacum TaxID=4097 RepID=A0A1S4C795_TOBAC